MGRRVTDAPYFSADVALLSSLADVFGSVMQNLQLQQRRLEQEQRARELSLHASRSELKALRAQINPHFLFNALNAIAGLIHRDPAVADRTVEQLAEVFRYALRGAESEWAVLDDELDFVRAYLEVERARFGDRLQVEVAMDDDARGARLPTMIVQTLVENAVKHVQVGRVFFKATAVVALTGLAMAVLFLIDPLGVKPLDGVVTQERAAAAALQIRLAAPFLAYLVLITFTPVYHGVRVLETRETPERLRTPFHTCVNVGAIVGAFGMIAVAFVARQPVYAALSPIGILAGRGNLRFARNPRETRMAWWYEHMGSIVGGGIAFHTAFLVIGAGRLLGIELTGITAVIPWVLPSIIGIPATAIWVGYYRRQFREDASAPHAVALARPSPFTTEQRSQRRKPSGLRFL